MKKRAKGVVYQDRAGEYRWRLVSSNGRTIADSGEGYTRRFSAHEAFFRMLDMALKDMRCVDM
jgi:uncharacterized protein YegP (UPF0339 family)